MSEHLSQQDFALYRQRRMTPVELLAFDEHLADCPACRRRLRDELPVQAALARLEANVQAVSEALRPTPTAAAAQASMWTKLGTALKWPALSALPLRFRLASAAAFLALLIAGGLLWTLTGKKQQREIAQLTPTPVSSPALPPPSPMPGAPILLALNDGDRQVTLDAQGHLSGLALLSPATEQRVLRALQTGKVEAPRTPVDLRPTPGALMGTNRKNEFELLAPVGEIVFSRRPTLRWRPLSGAAHYTVTITDPQNNYQEVAVSPPLTGTQWRVTPPLPRGRSYAWVVTAEKEGRQIKAPSATAGEAKFKILEEAQAAELAQARKNYAGSHLTMGVLYAQAGLLAEAEKEFRLLAEANPQAPVAQALLRDVRAKRR